MSKKATDFQIKAMSRGTRGLGLWAPLNTGWIDAHVACVREYIANIFFYKKDNHIIMIDAGYNYPRLSEKMKWLGIDPASIKNILITHEDTDHVGAIEVDSPGLFRNATIYISEIENKYLTGEQRRKIYWGLYKLPQITIMNKKILLKDEQNLDIEGVNVRCLLTPGHTWGHMVYLIDEKYLFTGDTIWFGPDGGYSFLTTLAESNATALRSLEHLEHIIRKEGWHPYIITGHTGWTDDLDFAFAHRTEKCGLTTIRKLKDPARPYDAYMEEDDTEENMQKKGYLKRIQEQYK